MCDLMYIVLKALSCAQTLGVLTSREAPSKICHQKIWVMNKLPNHTIVMYFSSTMKRSCKNVQKYNTTILNLYLSAKAQTQEEKPKQIGNAFGLLFSHH